MRSHHLWLIPLLAGLYACQPETPAQPVVTPTADKAPEKTAAESTTGKPTAIASAVSPAPIVQSNAVTAAEPTKPKAASPSKKTAPAAIPEKTVVAQKAAPVEVAPIPVTKADSIPTPQAPKVEAKSEIVLSEAEALLLAKKSNCLACHAIDKKLVGPAWKDIAAKYRGDPAAPGKLSAKVAKGGSGSWGTMAMPANSPRVSDSDIHSLVRFILSLK